MARNEVVVPQAKQALEQLKWETAREVGVNVQPGTYGGDIPAKQWGKLGGNMVKKLIQQAEQQLSGKA
ncbi:alpha/beta-type small acid-soluble spore protein [Carboxydothermus pertinax]|uniref:Spore protein n=1 Tax=Carboxydothermus pertinax TaxID=870242 RepID=A0A1L8CXP7_9THEO|nr:alpha/beta-type small acid-soluble spore protein [Carboxydothermus pertinax]GAV23706.1 spore protein [Carboxydothermus pertinax]